MLENHSSEVIEDEFSDSKEVARVLLFTLSEIIDFLDERKIKVSRSKLSHLSEEILFLSILMLDPTILED